MLVMSMVVVLMAMRIVMMVGKVQTLIPYLTLPYLTLP